MNTIFYDGVCGLCSRLTRFVLKRDRHDRFRFAALQGDYARAILIEHGRDPDDLDSMVVLLATNEVLVKARAALFVLHELGGGWRILSWLRVLPRPLLDWGYDRVAKSRYRIFGRHDACSIPSPADRAKFIEG